MTEETEQSDRSHGGASTHVSPSELLDICTVHLTDPECWSVSALARRFSRKRDTITRCLKSPEYKQLKEQILAERRDHIVNILHRGAARAAELWSTKTLDAAAERGNHRAMQDLLQHLRLIDPITDAEGGAKVVVQIGVKAEDIIIGLGEDGSPIRPSDRLQGLRRDP
jgi:hypothetical protein